MEYPKSKLNKVIRGNKRAVYNQDKIFDILDNNSLCYVSFIWENQPIVLPTSYGRKGEYLYLHGSASSRMLEQMTNGQQVCINVTELNGIVLAKTLFHTSVNFRSVVLFGKAEEITDYDEKIKGLEIIVNQMIPHRWDEVSLGDDNEIKATKVIKFKIESASAKIRTGAPSDEITDPAIWSGEIPIKYVGQKPIPANTSEPENYPESVKEFLKKNKQES